MSKKAKRNKKKSEPQLKEDDFNISSCLDDEEMFDASIQIAMNINDEIKKKKYSNYKTSCR